MDCERAMNWISAQLDGELVAEDRIRLDAHLSECASCRAVAESFRSQDTDLRNAFRGRRQSAAGIADRVISEIRAESKPKVRPISWFPLITAAAAGFVLAVFAFEVFGTRGSKVSSSGEMHAKDPHETQLLPLASLALATGPIEYCRSGETTWQPLATGASISEGWKIRTGSQSRCEFLGSDGSEIRVNVNSELGFDQTRKFTVHSGQIFSNVAHAEQPFEVKVADAKVTALGTQFDVLCTAAGSILTVIEGSTKVTGKGKDEILHSGEAAKIVDGKIESKNRVHDFVLTTRWANEILMLKGRHSEELDQRVKALLAQIGRTKMENLYEEEIRSMGDHCVMPLASYIESDQSKQDRTRRVRAARILSDIAQPWSIPELLQLLDDEDGEIRFFAATGLERLTGRTSSRTPDAWRDNSLNACSPDISDWSSWWQKNRERYPRPITLPEPKLPTVPKK